jgi:hypothetical protein
LYFNQKEIFSRFKLSQEKSKNEARSRLEQAFYSLNYLDFDFEQLCDQVMLAVYERVLNR